MKNIRALIVLFGTALSVLISGCSTSGPGLAMRNADQTLQGPIPLINSESFEIINLPLLLDPSQDVGQFSDDPNEPYPKGALENAFNAFYERAKGSDSEQQRLMRNRVQERILAASDQRCGQYRDFLKQYDSEFNFLLGGLTTATAGAGAIVSGGASQVLSGVAAIFSGIRAEGNSVNLSNQTVQVITDGFQLRRERKYKTILVNRNESLTEYPVERAVKDAIVYHSECSLVSGLEEAALAIERVRDPGLKRLSEAFSDIGNLQVAVKASNIRGGDSVLPVTAFTRAKAAREHAVARKAELATAVKDLETAKANLAKVVVPATEVDKKKKKDALLQMIDARLKEAKELQTRISTQPALEKKMLADTEKTRLEAAQKNEPGLMSAVDLATTPNAREVAVEELESFQAKARNEYIKYDAIRAEYARVDNLITSLNELAGKAKDFK